MYPIHLVDGETGGSGKSLFVEILSQYAFDRQQPLILVRSSLYHSFPFAVDDDFRSICLTSSPTIDCHPARLVRWAEQHPVLIDLPPNVMDQVCLWMSLTSTRFSVVHGGLLLYRWWVTDGSPSNYRALIEVLTRTQDLGLPVQHILVKNLGRWCVGSAIEVPDVLEPWRLPVLTIPSLASWLVHRSHSIPTPFNYHLSTSGEWSLTLAQQQEINRFLEPLYSELDSLCFFNPVLLLS